MIRIVASLLIACSAAAAQSPGDLFAKAPPQVDQALRERVNKFYQAHVDGKWRLADQVVAEDSKDQFFAMSKPRYLKFEVLRISYTEDFAKATVVTVVEAEFNLRGNKVPSKAPVTTNWKVIDGDWFWYVDERMTREQTTPMGTMRGGPGSDVPNRPAGMPADFAAIMNDPKRKAELAKSFLEKVTINKTEVTLPSDKPGSETVEVSNALEGPIQLSVDTQGVLKGFSAALDKNEINPGGKAVVKLKYEPAGQEIKPLKVVVRVEQTSQAFVIEVHFAEPAPEKAP